MDAIEMLMDEHRLIERMLDALGSFASSVQQGSTDRVELGRFVEFIREYADKRHHAKEEEILFRAMVDGGFPRETGPIAVMLHEHEVGRRHVAELARLAAQEERWTHDDRAAVVNSSISYGNLLRAHIYKEDGILYPMAEERLSAEAMESVTKACLGFEQAEGAFERLAELHALGNGLLARHAAGGCAGCSGGSCCG